MMKRPWLNLALLLPVAAALVLPAPALRCVHDEMDLMGSTDYANMSFDDPISSPMFRQLPLNCVGSTSFMDNTKNDYDDTINQFLN